MLAYQLILFWLPLIVGGIAFARSAGTCRELRVRRLRAGDRSSVSLKDCQANHDSGRTIDAHGYHRRPDSRDSEGARPGQFTRDDLAKKLGVDKTDLSKPFRQPAELGASTRPATTKRAPGTSG